MQLGIVEDDTESFCVIITDSNSQKQGGGRTKCLKLVTEVLL